MTFVSGIEFEVFHSLQRSVRDVSIAEASSSLERKLGLKALLQFPKKLLVQCLSS